MGNLRSTKPLRAKVHLRTKTPLKKSTKLDKRPKSPRAKLKEEAWKQFSRYIRIRDTDLLNDGWYGKCITCSHYGRVAYIDENNKLRFTPGWDAGHYISRGNWYLRHDEENVNLQCKFHCNKMKSGNIEVYKVALDEKYGDGTREKLDNAARDNKGYNPPKEELEQVVNDAKECILWYQRMQIVTPK